MATAVQLPVSEYLRTTYHPDREYIDGELRERNAGKWEHARLQMLLAAWFVQHEPEWNIIGSTEQRMRVAPNRIRIPGLVVLRPGPQPDVLTAPPLLIVEILSPDDTYSELQERCEDYLRMGVETSGSSLPQRAAAACVLTPDGSQLSGLKCRALQFTSNSRHSSHRSSRRRSNRAPHSSRVFAR